MQFSKEKFNTIETKMAKADLPEIVINNFKYYYKQLVSGVTGEIPENDITPVNSITDTDEFSLQLEKIGFKNIHKTAVVKLNGGLGTSMGLERAKSLLNIKNNLTFLEIVAKQATQNNVPLVLMNSFATQQDSSRELSLFKQSNPRIPLDFLQHKVPKITQGDFSAVEWPENPDLEWCPPGHGDLFLALVTSGIMDQLLENGIEYIFVSNVDNLGAVLDMKILGYFVDADLSFMMEVTDRTLADSKGGHLAKLTNGRFVLREIAQCPENDLDNFQNIHRHKYFNTNNLWIDLNKLDTLLKEKNYVLKLPMIRNSKTVNPRDKNSTPVYQLETAMGSAISVFENAGAIRVPRTRFAPVKNTNDLLAVRSDLFIFTDDFRVIRNPAAKNCVISLDSRFFKMIDDFDARFPYGSPSLLNCKDLVVEGDVLFGKNVTIKNRTKIVNKKETQQGIKDNSVLQGEIFFKSNRFETTK